MGCLWIRKAFFTLLLSQLSLDSAPIPVNPVVFLNVMLCYTRSLNFSISAISPVFDSLVLIVLPVSPTLVVTVLRSNADDSCCIPVCGRTLPRREPCNCSVGTEVNMNSYFSTYSLDLFAINSLNIRNEDSCSWFQLFPVSLGLRALQMKWDE